MFCLLFTTFIRGLNLEKAWPRLDDVQKRNIGRQLNDFFSELRSLPFPAGMLLGGARGEGCKDARRGIHGSANPIMDVEQFEEFIFAGSRAASPIYAQLLRELIPTSLARRVVFTQGDLRPANVIVDANEDGAQEYCCCHKLGSKWFLSRILGMCKDGK